MTLDYMGRRVRKLVLELVDGEGPPTGSNPWGGNDGEVVDDMRYIYDGWNVVIERRVTDRTTVGEYPETAVRKYAWGLDLSGLNGAAASGNVQSAVHAGGIGGLLAIEDFTTQIGYENSRACIYFYDGNGNVGQLVTWKTGDPELVEEPGQLPWTPFNLPGRVAERYEYDPYGGTLLADDDYAVDNPFRFSTKYYDAQPSTAAAGERGLLYYGERYYSPRLGRWVNRDPIGEAVGINNYLAMLNNLVDLIDALGLSPENPYEGPGISPPPCDRMSSRCPTSVQSHSSQNDYTDACIGFGRLAAAFHNHMCTPNDGSNDWDVSEWAPDVKQTSAYRNSKSNIRTTAGSMACKASAGLANGQSSGEFSFSNSELAYSRDKLTLAPLGRFTILARTTCRFRKNVLCSCLVNYDCKTEFSVDDVFDFSSYDRQSLIAVNKCIMLVPRCITYMAYPDEEHNMDHPNEFKIHIAWSETTSGAKNCCSKHDWECENGTGCDLRPHSK
ncbi:MAG: RHS repeat-associated core domain-containing protein [Planctomycetes bacterium]|nr:RHS repeat-associated core domain-containing protein [Planctomycetota bacterium]